ncbi:hypothetical protein ABXS75_08385 [Roseburia hominis]
MLGNRDERPLDVHLGMLGNRDERPPDVHLGMLGNAYLPLPAFAKWTGGRTHLVSYTTG